MLSTHSPNETILASVTSSILASTMDILERMSSFGARLKQAREKRGFSQPQLADKIGISRQAIGQLENGSSKSMKPINLVAAADALGVDLRWLAIGGTESKATVNTYIDARVLIGLIEEIKHGLGGLPKDNLRLANLLANGYARYLLSAQEAGRAEIKSIMAKALQLDSNQETHERAGKGEASDA